MGSGSPNPEWAGYFSRESLPFSRDKPLLISESPKEVRCSPLKLHSTPQEKLLLRGPNRVHQGQPETIPDTMPTCHSATPDTLTADPNSFKDIENRVYPSRNTDMKPSHHPPLYLLVATVSFFLGTVFDPTDKSESSASTNTPAESAIRKTDPASIQPARGESTSVDSQPDASAEVPTTQQDTAPAPRGDITDVPATRPKPASPETKSAAAVAAAPVLKTGLGEVSIFTADNPWNQDVSSLPVHRQSKTWLRAIGLSDGLHPDFGTVWNGSPNGIPYVVVDPDQPKVPVKFEYDDESDPGPYPIPNGVPIEGGANAPFESDRHIILIDPRKKLLYELFQAIPDPIRGWRAGSGAIFDLGSDKLRPDGWTSADAAGLPVFPGLVRYDEVADGEIRHALRFTVERTQRAYIHPARHFASRRSDATLPPMGLRVRLRADYDISEFPRSAQTILTALKRYGMLLADNGSDWFISGAPDPRWKDSELATLKRVRGRDLECVFTGPLKQ